MADDELVTITTSDGQDFKLEVRLAKEFETLKGLLLDVGTDQVIPLPNVTGKTLGKMLDFARFHLDKPDLNDPEKYRERLEKDSEFKTWYEQFFQIPDSELFELILTSNHLDHKVLLDRCCLQVALSIRGKTPEEIRHRFNIQNDLSPQEEEEIKKENEWVNTETNN
jgi:S-phase kinase-associated protein 1